MKDKYSKKEDTTMKEVNVKSTVIISALVILAILIVVINPIAIVGVGERGVKVTLGQVSPQSFTEGIHVVTPFISKIYTIIQNSSRFRSY